MLGISPAAFRMRLASARRVLGKAVATGTADDAAPGETGLPVARAPAAQAPAAQAPVSYPRNSHLKEAVQ